MIAVLCLVFSLIFGLSAANTPIGIDKCKVSDTNCIMGAIGELLRRYPEGNPAIGLPNISGINLKNLTISKENSNSAVQLNFKLLSANFYGFEGVNVTRVVGFDRDPEKSKFEVYGVIPHLEVKGQYECNGKILLLPINGNGDADIKLKNLKFATKSRVSTDIRDGKTFVYITQVKAQVKTDRMYVQLDNLFNGNKELSDALNRVLDENWSEVWNEVESGINNAVGEVVKIIMSSVVNKLPYDDFFAP